jgi:hypothetical protein
VLNRYEYLVLSCNAKIANLVHPICTAVSEGVFVVDDGPKEVWEKAQAAGWTESGRGGHLCPIHSVPGALLVEQPKAKRAPKAREEILDAVVTDVPAE